MKTILVTGGAGYIGTHTIVELLKNPDYDVIIVDNFSNSNPFILNRLYEICGRPIKVYNKDCRDNMDDIISEHKIDGIIHFAAYKSVSESIDNPLLYYDNNINSLLNILDICKTFNIKSLVFSSSCSLYGNLTELPANEESKLSDPESPYAYTKLVCERILKDFSKKNDTKIISLRYFNPVGAHSSGLIGECPVDKPSNIIPIICNSIDRGEEIVVFGNDYDTVDGTCVRDYVHVSDIGSAHLKAFEYIDNIKSYDVFNIGSDVGVSVLEIINAFERVNNVKLNYRIGDRRTGDVAKIYSDSSKIKGIGWSPLFGIDDMVSSAFKWNKNKNL